MPAYAKATLRGAIMLDVHLCKSRWLAKPGYAVFLICFSTTAQTNPQVPPEGQLPTRYRVVVVSSRLRGPSSVVFTADANPQGHLSLTNAQGNVLLSGDVLLLNLGQIDFLSARTTLESISPVVNVIFL